MYLRILKIIIVVIAAAQFGLSATAIAQPVRNASTASGQSTLAGNNGPAAILALPQPANGAAHRTYSSNTSSKSGTSAKVMPVRRPGTTGR